MPVITELMSVQDIDAVCRYADIIQIGARNMQNFMLLDEVGKVEEAGAAEARRSAGRSKSGCSPPSTSWRRATRT